jgi:hypothetical protein
MGQAGSGRVQRWHLAGHERGEPLLPLGCRGSACCHNVAMRAQPDRGRHPTVFLVPCDKNGPVPDPATGIKSKCWLWLGSVTDQGYGRFKAGGKTYLVSRYAWREMGKPDPRALTVSIRHLEPVSS